MTNRKKELFLKQAKSSLNYLFEKKINDVLNFSSWIETAILLYLLKHGNIKLSKCLVKKQQNKYENVACITFSFTVKQLEDHFYNINRNILNNGFRKLISAFSRYLPEYTDAYLTKESLYISIDSLYSSKIISIIYKLSK